MTTLIKTNQGGVGALPNDASKYFDGTGNFSTPPGGTSGAPHLIVAAFDAPAAVKADAAYVCDGTDDQVEIQAAINTLPVAGGVVELSSGNFSTSATISWDKDSVTLMGQGVDATQLTSTSATFDGIIIGTRQTGGPLRNFTRLNGFTFSHAGGASTHACIKIDGGGRGTIIQSIQTNEGGYGFLFIDCDRCYFEALDANNFRTAGISCQVGLENTYGTCQFVDCSQAISDNNTTGFEFTNTAGQASPNRFDRIGIYNNLFFATSGRTGTIGLKMTVGATAFIIANSLFENNVDQVSLIGETQLNFQSCSWIYPNVSATLVKYQTNNHTTSFTDCRFQQATIGFSDVSGFSRISFYGHNTNQGNIATLFSGSFASREGTDVTFAQVGVLSTLSPSLPYSYYITNDSGIYNAHNGATNLIDYSSSNLDTVISSIKSAISTNPALIEFGPGNFTTTTGIQFLRGNLTVKGQGQGITNLLLSAAAADSTVLFGINPTNTATNYALTSNIAAGDLTIPISPSDSTHMVANDYFLVSSNLDIDTENPGRKQGDLYICQSVNTTTGVVTIGSSGSGMDVRQAFTTANTSVIQRLINFYENIVIEGISFRDLGTSRTSSLVTGQTTFQYIYNLTIKDCSFRDMFYAGIRFYQCWNVKVRGCDFRNINDVTPSSNTYYGTEIRGATTNVDIVNCTFHDMRHGVTQGAGGATVLAGQTRNINITGNSSSATTTAHFDFHQGAISVLISNNTCTGDDGAANAIQSRSPATISGNTIAGIKGKGISLFGAASGSVVIGNWITGCVNGIAIDTGVTDCLISGNTITQTGSGYPIQTVATGGLHGGDNSIITGNYIYGNTTTTYGILMDSCSNVFISGNKIATQTAVRILTTVATGTNIVVQGNFLSGLGGTPFQNFIASSTHVIKDNFGYNMKGTGGATIATPFPTGAGNVTNTASTNAAPDSATLYTNVTSPKTYTVTGGTVSVIAINGVGTGLAQGAFNLGLGDTIMITYSVAPTVVVKIS